MKPPFISRKAHERTLKELAEARATIDRMKGGKIPESVRPKTEEVFRDPEGRVYYRFKEVTEMPWRYAGITRVWMEWAEMNMTPELYREYLDKITDNLNEGNLVRAAALVENMRQRANLMPHAEIIWKLAALLYLRDDENPHEPSDAMMDEKITYWKSVPKIRDFFLSMCLKELFSFGKKSQRTILDYLKKDTKMTDELSRVLQGMQLQK